jgi:AraC-like DNA-binding protein
MGQGCEGFPLSDAILGGLVVTALGGHNLIKTNRLDEARDRVAAIFCPHRLETIGTYGQFAAVHNHLPGQRLSLNYIEYGARTLIAPGQLDTFYLLQIPLQGGAEIVNGAAAYQSNPQIAAVLNPHLPTGMIWQEGTQQVLVQIARSALQDHMAMLLGHETDLPVTFDGPLDLSKGAGAQLKRLILWMVHEADQGAAPLNNGLMARQIESAVLSGLIDAAHGHKDPVEARKFTPRHLRLAEEYIAQNLDQPIALEDIACAAGISIRGLQQSFRALRGSTPLEFWRDARLARAHSDLLQAGAGTTVTDVALRWGFTHFGRFSAAYRTRYGVLPRDTLRKGN